VTIGSTVVSPPPRTHHHADFAVDGLLEAKRGRTVSVCLPARDEAETVGTIAATIVRELQERHALVDELLVVDDGSSDATATIAEAAGARVLATSDVLPEFGLSSGKGDAMWRSLAASSSDVVVWCDADIRNFRPHFVTGLLGPLLLDESIAFVKGFYERSAHGRAGEGGRVTELLARPLVCHLFPHLAAFVQPLAGEYAGRRDVLECVPFVRGYGVDVALLIDLAATIGVKAMAQVDLGERVHRNRSLEELSPQAMEILQTALQRAGVPRRPGWSSVLVRPGSDPIDVVVGERPPLAEISPDRRVI